MTVDRRDAQNEVRETPLSTDGPDNEVVIHIVDDHEDTLKSFSLLLNSYGYSVEVYYSANHFLSAYRSGGVECLLLDLRMPDQDGLELQETLRTHRMELPIVFISAYAETADIVAAVQNGAIDFLTKPVDERVLLSTIQTALHCDRRNKESLFGWKQLLSKLTTREREVVALLLEAKTTHSIANQLGISPKTVETHRANIFQKLRVNSVPELMRMLLG